MAVASGNQRNSMFENASALLAALALLVGCSQKTATGTYVGKYANAAIMLEIVQTADGHLTGKYSSVIVQKSGKLENVNAPITGVVDNDQVSLELHPLGILPVSVTLTGTLENRSIKLHGDESGGKIEVEELTIGQVSEFEEQATKVRSISQAILNELAEAERKAQAVRVEAKRIAEVAKTREKTLAEITALVDRADRFDKASDDHLTKFAKVGARYDEITNKMQSMLERERQTPSSFGRGQISFQISMAADWSGPTEAAHGNVEAVKRDYSEARKSRATEFATLEVRCEAQSGTDPEMQAACVRLTEARKNFDVRVEGMNSAFAGADQSYAAAKAKQEEIVAEAKRLER